LNSGLFRSLNWPNWVRNSGAMQQRLWATDFGVQNWMPTLSDGRSASRAAVSASGAHRGSLPAWRRANPCTHCGFPPTTSQSPMTA
jgi:hypothetical protein